MANSNDIKIPEIAFDWYDDYAHGAMDRRSFMHNLSTITTATLTMSALTSSLLPNYANAEQVSFNDPDIVASYKTFASPKGYKEGRGYWVEPTHLDGKTATVLVIHENRGLNPYVKDVARRLAKAGFIAFAPDALYPLGGYPGNDDEGRTMQRSMSRDLIEEDFIAAARFVKQNEKGNGRLGAVGFCFGGYIVNMLAARLGEELNAGVPFYGTPAKPELRHGIRAPLLIQLAENDKRVNATWPDYENNLKKLGVIFKMHMYENAKHGFHNDSTSRYDPDAAELAWSRTIEFFRTYLGGLQR